MSARITAILMLLMIIPPKLTSAQQPSPQPREIYVIPFSHLDLFWACTQEECLSRGNNIISKAIQLSEKNANFRFLLENEDFVENFVESHRGTPELDTLKQLIKEGRIEIAPLWASIYQNLPRDEALVRNLVYGKRYAHEMFEVNPTVAHMADIPGFTRQYPQILSKADTPYMVMTRMGPPDLSLFKWRAPDGSSALVWNTIKGYFWGAGLGLQLDMTDERLSSIANDITDVEKTTPGPLYLGWGTDLWSPSQRLVDNIAVLNRRLSPAHFRLATAEEFFPAAAKTLDIPTIEGEAPSSWANIPTSLLPLWPPVMSATDDLITAEKFSAVNYALGFSGYPQKEFDALWKDALKSMDHNNDGQGGEIGDERKLGFAQLATLGAGQILRDSLRNIVERVERPFPVGTLIVVFNPLNWERSDVVKAHVTLFGDVETDQIDPYKKGLRLIDENGTAVPFQVEQYIDGSSRSIDLIFIARSVPSIGYKSYYLLPSDKVANYPMASEIKHDVDKGAGQSDSRIGSDAIENSYYRLTVDKATGNVEIFDKELQRVVCRDVAISAAEERGGDDQNVIFPTGRTIFNEVESVDIAENNPVRTVLRVTGAVAGVPIIQRISLYQGLKKVDFEDVVDWKPGKSMTIEQVFPLQQPNEEIRSGVPFGSMGSTDVMPKAGPHWDDEVSVDIWKTWRQIQDWEFAGTQDWGATISSDHQLISNGDTAIRVLMLRGTRSTPVVKVRNGQTVLDLRPPAGTYTFRYSFESGKGDWVRQKPWRTGKAFSTPLIPVSSVDELSHKSLPPEHSFFSVNADNLVLTALKKADGDETIVARLFETQGKEVETPIRFLDKDREFQPVNLLEENLPGGINKLLRVDPYEISTVKIRVR